MQELLQDGSVEVIIPSDIAKGQQVRDAIESQLRLNHFEEKEIFGVRLAFDEAIVNAIKHGNKMDERKNVRIHFRMQADRFEINITDEGNGYDPDSLPDSVTCYTDSTIALPLLTAYALARHAPRPLRRRASERQRGPERTWGRPDGHVCRQGMGAGRTRWLVPCSYVETFLPVFACSAGPFSGPSGPFRHCLPGLTGPSTTGTLSIWGP